MGIRNYSIAGILNGTRRFPPATGERGHESISNQTNDAQKER